MSMTLKITDIAPGILRLRLSEKHAQTLAERYKLIELPETLSESGIKVDETAGTITFPDGRIMSFSMIDGEEYDSLHESLEKEFEKNYTDYQAIIGAPEEEAKKAEKKAAEPKYTDGQVRAGLVPADSVPENAHFAVRFSILPDDRFYGLGEASRDRVELRGRAYQNWVRYQYNEISVPFLSSDGGYGFLVNANRRTFMDIGGREKDSLIILGENDEMDIFVFAGEGLYDILPKYTLLSGRPMLLPKWAYGLTYIAPIFGTQHDVLSHAERFRKEHIPCDMFSLEPGWMKKFYDYSTKKEWATERFHVTDYMVGPNSDITFISALKRYGFHLALWICIRHDLTGEAERELARLNDPQYNAESDTYGESWYEHLKKFTDLGIAGYKLDPADMVCCFDRMSRPTCRNGLSPDDHARHEPDAARASDVPRLFRADGASSDDTLLRRLHRNAEVVRGDDRRQRRRARRDDLARDPRYDRLHEYYNRHEYPSSGVDTFRNVRAVGAPERVARRGTAVVGGR